MVLGIWGVAELILGICGAGQNIIRELRIFVRDLGKSMHYFKGARNHRPPPGGLLSTGSTQEDPSRHY